MSLPGSLPLEGDSSPGWAMVILAGALKPRRTDDFDASPKYPLSPANLRYAVSLIGAAVGVELRSG